MNITAYYFFYSILLYNFFSFFILLDFYSINKAQRSIPDIMYEEQEWLIFPNSYQTMNITIYFILDINIHIYIYIYFDRVRHSS